jgi:adenine-specific DNA-methyltransferase
MTDNLEPEKLDLTSPDIAAEKQAELLRLFPEIRTEGGKIDFDRLRLALGETVDVGKERYGMNWPGKADCFKAIQRPSLGTLRPVREESVNFDETENLIIEGDNLEVLKLLQKSYQGKVKMIYIDPPYNTGNDFIYPDDYTESLQTYLEYTGQVDSEGRKFSNNTETDGRFHSKWLNMMYPRLYLSRNLLRDDGIIFISIDDAEVKNLKELCNEVFGEENYVATLVWDRNRKNDARYFSVGHEYMLAYFNNAQFVSEQNAQFRIDKQGVDDVRTEFERLVGEHKGDYQKVRDGLLAFYSTFAKDDPRLAVARFTKVDEKGPYRDDGNINWPGGNGPRYEVLHPKTHLPCKVPVSGWRYPTEKRFWEEFNKGRVVFGEDEKTVPRVRTNLFENSSQVMGSVHYSYAQTASNDFNKIFDGVRVFENPKPVTDIEQLIRYVTEPGDTILDFFAGSGTAGHSVLEVNRALNSDRKFILVQLPEPTGRDDFKTIAEITKERVRRVIRQHEQEAEGKLNLGSLPKEGFRVLKLATSNFNVWSAATETTTPDELAQQLELHIDHIQKGRYSEDLLDEILLKSGFPLTTPVETIGVEGKAVYSVANGAMLICLDKQLTHEAIKAIADLKPERVVCLDEGFAGNDQLKTNAVLIMKSKGVIKFQTV